MTLLRIMVLAVATLATVFVLSTFCVFGLCGSASFGTTVFKRSLSRLSALLMLSLLVAGQHLFQSVSRPAWYWVVVFNALLLLVAWSFIRTAFSDPGTPDCPEWLAWRRESGCDDLLAPEAPEKGRSKLESPPGQPSYCDKCHRHRPERAHHCQVCGTCVLRMDHHCPLVGNCIGWRNHKYYLVLQWWQLWASVVFLFVPDGPGQAAMWKDVRPLGVRSGLLLDFALVWSCVLGVIAGRTLVVATFMALRNETHIEAHKYDMQRNPYMMPSAMGNLELLLGQLDLWLFLPVAPFGQFCRGTSFPFVMPNSCEVPMPKTVSYGSA